MRQLVEFSRTEYRIRAVLLIRIAIRRLSAGLKPLPSSSAPMWAHGLAGRMEVPIDFSFVVETIRLDTARPRCSIAHIPADGAEGAEMG